jgi:hypothetical protein
MPQVAAALVVYHDLLKEREERLGSGSQGMMTSSAQVPDYLHRKEIQARYTVLWGAAQHALRLHFGDDAPQCWKGVHLVEHLC